MRKIAFVTGVTGLLGSWLARLLIDGEYEKVYVLARGRRGFSAEDRVMEALKFSSGNGKMFSNEEFRKVGVLEGDICNSRLGLTDFVSTELISKVTDIFHCAALTDLSASYDSVRLTNVEGTRNVLDLALSKLGNGSSSLRVHYVSSVTVAGTTRGNFNEEQFNEGQQFNNGYERSKFEAERLVLQYRKRGVDISIYRSGIIMGDSRSGHTRNFKTIYQPLRFLVHNIFTKWPASTDCALSLVPVDKVAEAIFLLAKSRQKHGCAWHLVSREETRLLRLVDIGVKLFGCRKPDFVRIQDFRFDQLSAQRLKMITPFVPYLNYTLRFGANCTKEALRESGFEWPRVDDAMIMKLFLFCKEAGFIRSRQVDGKIQI